MRKVSILFTMAVAFALPAMPAMAESITSNPCIDSGTAPAKPDTSDNAAEDSDETTSGEPTMQSAVIYWETDDLTEVPFIRA